MTNTKSKRTDSRNHDSLPGDLSGVDVLTRDEIKTQKPPLYKVFILNDDFTPMDFVIEVLETIFNKSHEDATRIMLLVHRKGTGLCGVYPFDSAETKVTQVHATARAAEHPLRCTMEKE